MSRPSRIAVYFIFMPQEAAETENFLIRLRPQLHRDCRAFGVLNGDDPQLARRLEGLTDFVRILEPGANLGVAGGRNLAIRHALDWGAELLVSLDNDLLFPRDYLARAATEYAALSCTRDRVGIAAPGVLDYHSLAHIERSALFEIFRTTDNDRIIDALFGGSAPDQDHTGLYYHLGAVNWQQGYLASPYLRRISRRLVRRALLGPWVDRQWLPLASDSYLNTQPWAARAALVHGSVLDVDTVPGGVHVMSAGVIDAVGGFDETFNPFGFEDSELCIRALRAGFTNHTLGRLTLVHDIHGRLSERPRAEVWRLRGKMRAIFLRRFLEGPVRTTVILDSTFLQPLWILTQGAGPLNVRLTEAAAYLKAFGRHLLLSEALTPTGTRHPLAQQPRI